MYLGGFASKKPDVYFKRTAAGNMKLLSYAERRAVDRKILNAPFKRPGAGDRVYTRYMQSRGGTLGDMASAAMGKVNTKIVYRNLTPHAARILAKNRSRSG